MLQTQHHPIDVYKCDRFLSRPDEHLDPHLARVRLLLLLPTSFLAVLAASEPLRLRHLSPTTASSQFNIETSRTSLSEEKVPQLNLGPQGSALLGGGPGAHEVDEGRSGQQVTRCPAQLGAFFQ